MPKTPHGLAAAGAYLLAADPSGAWATHYTFDFAANLISAVEWNYFSSEYAWSDANSRMYFFRDDTSPDELQWEGIDPASGAITAVPCHRRTAPRSLRRWRNDPSTHARSHARRITFPIRRRITGAPPPAR